MLRNFGIFAVVVIASAVLWTLVAEVASEVAISHIDVLRRSFGFQDTNSVVEFTIIVVGLVLFYSAGFAYARLSGDRSLVRAAMVGLALVAAMAIMGTTLSVTDEGRATRPEPSPWQHLMPIAILIVPASLSTLGGWVAGRRRPALRATQDAAGEPDGPTV